MRRKLIVKLTGQCLKCRKTDVLTKESEFLLCKECTKENLRERVDFT